MDDALGIIHNEGFNCITAMDAINDDSSQRFLRYSILMKSLV